MKRIVEVLEPALGPAHVVDEKSKHVIGFRPRAYLAELEANKRNRVDGLQDVGEQEGQAQLAGREAWTSPKGEQEMGGVCHVGSVP